MNKTFDQVFRQVYKDMTMITRETRENYDQTHGGPFDRGSADSYYGRERNPHYWPEGTNIGRRRDMAEMTSKEVQAYLAGYQWNEQFGDKKDWG